MLKRFITLLIITSLLACSDDDSNPADSNDPGNKYEKSPKRGLAYNMTDAADFDALKDGVSWWYNWYFKTDAPENYYDDYEMEFLPMLWGSNPSSDYAETIDFIMDHPEIEYLLVLNEPNLTDQANQLPYQAAAEWLKYEAVIDELASRERTVYLVGPAMTWGTMTDFEDPVAWLDAFYEAYRAANNGRDPKIDYLAFHWYDYGLEQQLDRLQKYGKQIWVTEMANWNPQINSYTKQVQQMQDMVALCESRDDVFRYAWFIGRGSSFDDKYTYLFNPTPGELNSLGEFYLSLPYQE